MRQFLKLVALFAVIFSSSCKSSSEKRFDAAMDAVTSHHHGKIEMIIEDQYSDSISSVFNDSTCIVQGMIVSNHLQSLNKSLQKFKNLYSSKEPRIWLKTLSETEKSHYEQVEKEHSNTFWAYDKLYGMVRMFDNNKKSPYKVMTLKYCCEGKEYIGLMYYDYNDYLVKTIILSKNQYDDIVSIILNAQKEIADHWGSSEGNWIPNYETIGIDIVPVDEDPTKTKAQREEIKRRAEEQERLRKEQERIRNEKAIDNKIVTELMAFIRGWNRGGATQVDEMTIAEKAVFKKPNIYYYYTLIADKSEFSDYQWKAMESTMRAHLKEECGNILQYFVANEGLSKYQIKEAFKRIGLNWTYIYKDIYGRTLMSINITADDLY